MDDRDLEDLATTLRKAEASVRPVPPLVEVHADLTLDDAYRTQLLNVRARIDRGGRVAGHKVGLTSLAMQETLGIDQPDFGHLFADMFHPGHLPISVDAFIAPKVEPEIAFVLGKDLRGPQLTLADIIRAVDFVLPSLEIIDSRIEGWRITLVDTVADNASSAGVVLGTTPSRLEDRDLADVSCTMTHNRSGSVSGTGRDVLGHPLNALLWLANRLGEYDTVLEAGHVVLPGSCTKALDVQSGDVVHADFGALGTVTATFA